MVPDSPPTSKPNSAVGWLLDIVAAGVSAFILTIVVFIGTFVYAVGRGTQTTTRIPGFLEVVVDDRGGFEAAGGGGIPLVFLVLGIVALLVARLIRRARRRGAASP